MRLVSLLLLFFTLDAVAQIRPFQTARLTSTAGAGVASLLVSETAIINPAALAFFSDTFVSYQNTSVDVKNESDARKTDSREFPGGSRHEGYFLFDNSSELKGGFSYQYQRENGFTRKRGTVTMAAPISSSLSYGILYKYTDDLRPLWYTNSRHKISHPFTMGLTWIVTPELILGATWDDPGRAIKGESRATAGIQYNITSDFLLLADAGGDPTGDYYDKRLWRAALQYNVFADFYARGGRFQDRSLNLEGTGWGLSWTGPKLGVDFAMRESRQIRKEVGYLYDKEKIVDVTLAANVRF